MDFFEDYNYVKRHSAKEWSVFIRKLSLKVKYQCVSKFYVCLCFIGFLRIGDAGSTPVVSAKFLTNKRV